MVPVVGAGGETLACADPIWAYGSGRCSGCALDAPLSSRVGRETETGSRNLLLFGLQSRGCTTAVSVLEACSGPVPWQRRESDRMS